MSTARPIRKQGNVIRDLGSESRLYIAEGKVIHVLNPTAKLVWKLCDGTHTIKDMDRAIRANFSMSKEHDVAGDIKRTLELFATKGVIEKQENLMLKNFE